MSSQSQNVAQSPPPPVQTPFMAENGSLVGMPWSSWLNWAWSVLRKTPVTVAGVAALPTNLGKTDAGLLYWDSVLQHMYQWTGSLWIFGPGDDHMAGKIVAIANGAVIDATIWKVCDGTVYAVSKGDGTTGNVTTPILNTTSFIVGAAAQTAVIPATNPSFTGGAHTDNESAHTHSITQSTGNIGAGGAAYDAVGSTNAGSAHNHVLSNANAPITAGLPQNIALVFYMRL